MIATLRRSPHPLPPDTRVITMHLENDPLIGRAADMGIRKFVVLTIIPRVCSYVFDLIGVLILMLKLSSPRSPFASLSNSCYDCVYPLWRGKAAKNGLEGS